MEVTVASLLGVACSLLLIALSYVILYFVIRLAVRHALKDVDRRRAHGGLGYPPPHRWRWAVSSRDLYVSVHQRTLASWVP